MEWLFYKPDESIKKDVACYNTVKTRHREINL